MNLIAIIPRLPPVVDGIGDYALSLAHMLRDHVGINTRFIITDPAWPGANDVDSFEVRRLKSHSADELLNLLVGESSAGARVLLHYEGYGYALRGSPFWLVEAFERWRRSSDKRLLVTIFHELYASGPPWTSSFWLSRVQRNLTTRLARLSDQCLTSLEFYSRVLQKMGGNDSSTMKHLAVFSTIGEPQSASPLKHRRRRLAVFGTRGRRIEVYKRSATDLNRICAALGIEEIVDIGRSIDFNISAAVKPPVVTCAEMPASGVSELLLNSIAGVIDYPAWMLAKSSILAAYCSHRVIPIVADHSEASPGDGLEANVHYWRTNVRPEHLTMAQGQVIADSALAWYQGHNLAAHARLLAACVDQSGARSHVQPGQQYTNPLFRGI